MSYYQNNEQVPIFGETVTLNDKELQVRLNMIT